MRTELLAVGILGSGSRLGDRIETLLTRRAANPGCSRLLGGFFTAALMALAVASSSAPRWIAFAQEARPSFEVASVKSNKDAAEGSFVRVNPTGIDYSRVPLTRIIAEAYQIPYARIIASDSRIRELLSETYDIRAKTDHAASREQLMLMLQALLQDRFKLSLSHESRIQPVYRLAVLKDGPKLRESTSDNGVASGALTANGVVFRNMTMWRLAALLTGRLDRPVVDATGLAGVYDFDLELQSLRDLPQLAPETAKAVVGDWSSSSIFSDIRKLGLSLEPNRAPVDNLRIDRLERPDAN
jgi:uncharacterized protein (TIGR03435 family)